MNLKARAAEFVAEEFQLTDGVVMELIDSDIINVERVRNRMIRRDYQLLQRNLNKQSSITVLSEQYCLAHDTVTAIVYNKTKY